ncbi:MAG: hypothetical protein ACREJ2_00165 [Planctomycetota bacterium]
MAAPPAAQHFYFKSPNGRYRVHVGTKGPLVMASCQGVARVKMDTQRLMVERKHFGLKFHLASGSREMVDLILFTNRAEVKEVRVRIDGLDLEAVSEAMYRTGETQASGVSPAASTLVQGPPGLGLAGDLQTPSLLPAPEHDDVLDRLAIMTGSGKHPAVGRISEPVVMAHPAGGSGPVPSAPTGAARGAAGVGRSRLPEVNDPDIVPPAIDEDAPTPAFGVPAVPPAGAAKAPARPGATPASAPPARRAGSGTRPSASGSPGPSSGVRRGVPPETLDTIPSLPSAAHTHPDETARRNPIDSGIAPGPSRKVKPARSSVAAAAKSSVQSRPAGVGSRAGGAGVSAALASAAPAAGGANVKPAAPAVPTPSTPSAGADQKSKPAAPGGGMKTNKNAVVPEGELQVPEGLDDLLKAADEVASGDDLETVDPIDEDPDQTPPGTP